MDKFIEYTRVDELLPFIYAKCVDNPHYLFEAILLVVIIRVLFQKSYRVNQRNQERLTEKEKDQLVNEWTPDPLCQPLTENELFMANPTVVLTGKPVAKVQVEGVNGPVLNLAAQNFLGFVGNSAVEDTAVRTVEKYGCGSCGPRGFYGTIDVHLELEKNLAEFCASDEAILYASGFNTVSSAIPAFLKRGDVILCDEAVNFSIQCGLNLSRSDIKFFKHNDTNDLERLLQEVVARDKRSKKEPMNRRFICVEGIYANYGDIAPLKKIVELKEKYKFRMLMDESYSLGVLGQTGRGLTELAGVKSTDVEVMTASLANTFASVGGFCAGTHEVVDHQRLSGAAYCFSASVVPFLATTANAALGLLVKQPELVSKLQANSKRMFAALNKIKGLKVSGDPLSPLMHIRLATPRDDALDVLKAAFEQLLHQEKVLLHFTKYVPQERQTPLPSLRVTVSVLHDAKDIDAGAAAIERVFQQVLSKKL
eukprot:TRINITY_DN5631_c0_g1_i1.p1 TRINITY_DN5631_c0_g1~~TRINITY_DN5631_c0_g1_i1.p1  ORF type:complete len:481 (-),score=146.82 TRINITY_DN5631_c0_g1_i1:36-1478(-)